MNTHKSRSRPRPFNLTTLVMALLVAFVLAFGFAAGTAQSPREVAQGRDIKEDFNDDDLKVERVRGKWGAALMSDMSQVNDSSLPVVVGGIQSLSWPGKYPGVVKIKRVEIRNRSPRVVNAVQLRWAVANLDEPQKVLSEDTTPFVQTWVEANSSLVIEIPTLYMSRVLKPLAKRGELYGQFQITIGLQEARFADGSF